MNNAIFVDALNADWLLNYILICLNCFKPQIPTIFILMLDYEYTYDDYPTMIYFTPIFPNVGRGGLHIHPSSLNFAFQAYSENILLFRYLNYCYFLSVFLTRLILKSRPFIFHYEFLIFKMDDVKLFQTMNVLGLAKLYYVGKCVRDDQTIISIQLNYLLNTKLNIILLYKIYFLLDQNLQKS